MNKKFLTTALAISLSAMAWTASAAQPFSDVPEDSWAYQAVESLAKQQVIEGYPDGEFKGDHAITRYELAQMVARLLAKKETLTQEQQQTVLRLAQEYSAELKNLGVRLNEVEKKAGKTLLITELRVHGINRYDNVYRGHISKHYETGVRLRANTITTLNERVRLYGQLETYMSMNGTPMYDVNGTYNAPHNKDSQLHLGHLFTTYQFGQVTPSKSLMGATKNLIGIGQFPVKMGVTGYTYDGHFKGAFIQLGDAEKGGHFRFAVGRATDINYDYTAPMMRGVEITKEEIGQLAGNAAAAGAIKAGQTPEVAKALADKTAKKIVKGFAVDPQATYQTLAQVLGNPQSPLAPMAKKLKATGRGDAPFIYYPMRENVEMVQGKDEDVPAVYVSYIYKNPGQFEFHAYALKATGPVGHICRAYGTALSYHVTPKFEVHGEYVKNMQKLPLNNEQPHNYVYGISYGKANILQGGSYSFGVDYVYSQAGSYFGGSGSDIADQYMGHIYTDWRNRGKKYGPMPAYLADKMGALLAGKPSGRVGGAKFYLAKVSYVPMMGLILEGSYGFNASDMGGRKMDNIFMFKATAFIK